MKCDKCTNEAASGRKLCQKHLDQSAVRQRKYRQKNRSAGNCERCKKPSDRIGVCSSCLPKYKEDQHKRHIKRYSRRKEQNKCVDCEKPSVKNKTMCQTCLDRRASNQMMSRIQAEEVGLCSQCKKNVPIRGKRCEDCKKKRNEWHASSDYKKRYEKIRAQNRIDVIDHYGGKCVCCGETELHFLAIDHPNNDGGDERKKVGAGSSFYAWLIRNDLPDGYVVLCHNCNFGRHLNGGICPHQEHENKL